jgi:hypothetical protein
MSIAENSIVNMISEARTIGADFVGSLVSLSVSIDDNKPLNNQTVINAIENDSRIPNEWAPDGLNLFSIYVNTITELRRSRLDNFILPFAPNVDFDPARFGGYEIQKLHHASKEDMPAIHRVFFRDKIKSDDKDLKNTDLDFPHSILVKLKRTFGNYLTDTTGESKFQILVESDKCPDEFLHLYEPFTTTLHQLFSERCDGVFTGRQARDLLMDVIINRVGSYSINKGLYFVDGPKVESVMALTEVLNSLDPGINIVNVPVLRFKSEALNMGFSSLSTNLSDAVLKAAVQMRNDLMALKNKDSKTHASTWDKRSSEYKDLRNKIQDYHNRELIQKDIMEDMIKEISDILTEVL